MIASVEIENQDNPLTKNVFVDGESCFAYSWYGGSYFEIFSGNAEIIHLSSKEEFNELVEVLQKLQKELDK